MTTETDLQISNLKEANRILTEALTFALEVYFHENPMRTADVHDDDCACLRCAMDCVDEALATAHGYTENPEGT